jgi:hypothetical protein
MLRLPEQGFKCGQIVMFSKNGLQISQVLQNPFRRFRKGAFQRLDGVPQLFDFDPGLVEGGWVFVRGQGSQVAECQGNGGLQADPGGLLRRYGLEWVLQGGDVEEAAKIRQMQAVEFFLHGAPGLGAASVHLFQDVLEDGSLDGRTGGPKIVR